MLLPAITLLFSALTGPASQRGDVMQERKFDAEGYHCVFRIKEIRLASTERNEIALIECAGRTVLEHNLQDAGIGNIAFRDLDEGSYPQHERIAVSWERGTGAGLTVFEVARFDLSHSGSLPGARVVFEHWSKCGAEVFEQGDVLLANVGHRVVDNEILPSGTNVYRWKDGKYVFDHAFRWKVDASDSDRYCILLNPTTCPAEVSSKPLPISD